MKKMFMYLSCLSLLVLAGCSKENNTGGEYADGVFITNEGVYNGNNGSVSFYCPSTGELTGDIFYTENLRPLGDVVQSMTAFNGLGFIVVNNSQKMEVVKLSSFESLATVEELAYPRHFLGISESLGYLTDGSYSGQVLKINLEDYSVSGSITVGNGPENLIMEGDKVYVANSGGWTYDNTVSVIDIASDAVCQTVEVGDQPADLVVDADGMIWAICAGKVVYTADYSAIESETASCLCKIDPSSYEVSSIEIGSVGDYFNPTHLAVSPDGTTLYFGEIDGIHALDIEASKASAEPLIAYQAYGLDVDPETGNIYVLVSGGSDSAGNLYVYTSDGNLVEEVEAGYFPNGVVFPE